MPDNNPHTFLRTVSNKITMCYSGDSIPEYPSEINAFLSTDGGQSPLNRILISLQGRRRRYLLYFLQKEDSCDLQEAARRIGAWELDCDLADVPPEVHSRIESELYHTHLPKLEDLNIIDYDERSAAIRLRNPPEKFDSFLELAQAEDGLD